MMRDLIGQQLGNYRLVKVLGRGGFAEVYLGQHVRLLTEVAIKVLHTHLSEEQIMGFEQEAKTIASLEHPHIVRVFDFDVSDGFPFLVMDYCPDGTLRKRHAKGECLPLSTVVSYVQQVAAALQYAHDQKIIHRDIKPENMLIGQRSTLLLSDFGIAATAHSTSSMSSQIPVGTIPYMAPEQIQAQARPASDQYALGIVVYEWLGGTRPFEGSYTEIFAKHLMTPPPSLLEKVPILPPEVEQVVLTALAKDPKQRFPSVQVFATALEQASQSGQSGSSVSLRGVTPLSLPEQSQPSAPSPVAAPSSQPLPPTITVTPPHHAAKRNTETLAPSHPSQVSEVLGIRLPIAQWMEYTSRRAVIADLVGAGFTLIGCGGIIWFVTSLKPASHIPIGTLLYTYQGHSDAVNAVAWSSDGKRIASGSDDKTVQVWDVVDGGNVFIYKGHSDQVWAVAWSPDGKRVASGSWDKTVQVWDAVDGDNAFTYQGHRYEVWAVAWSSDGKRIASGSSDETVQVWDAVDRGNVFIYKGHSDSVYAVAWSPDGKRIASGSYDKTVQVWNAVDGSNAFTYQRHSDQVNAVAWSPDGKRIASGSNDATVQVWNAADGSHVYIYKGHSNDVNAVAWSPDGKRVASGSSDSTVQVWDAVGGGNIFTYRGHSQGVFAVAWSLDGKRIASGSWDKTVQVWEAS